MNYREALDFLFSLEFLGIRLGLRNISRLLRELGDPQHSFLSIHIAGTNGKGSTAAMVESVLRSSGYRTGLYTSPHLFDFRERIRVNGRPIPARKVSQGLTTIEPSLRRCRSTFFEAATTLALHHFREACVEVAVIEVGMGGRLDATNVISPLCTIITDIDKDHTEFLGHSLERIAAEKAAIIKEGGTVITSVTQPSIMRLLKGECRRKGARLYATTKECHLEVGEMRAEGSRLNLRTPHHSLADLHCPLSGRHQFRNLAAAILALDALDQAGLSISAQAMKDGIAKTVWPGRLHILRRDPLCILDGAHNPGGIRVLRDALGELFSYRHLVLVLGVMASKDYSEMVRTIVPLASHVIVTRPHMERALDAHILAEEVSKHASHVTVIPSVTRAMNKAMELAGPGDAVCAAGSLFLVGEILKKNVKDLDALFGLDEKK